MTYVIFVKNEEESKRVQDILFAAGKGWDGGRTKIDRNTSASFLYASPEKPHISTGEHFTFATNGIKRGEYVALEATEVKSIFSPVPKEKMITINGKKWSESTIKEALRRYANE